MFRKKIEIVELNKEKEEIILEKKQSKAFLWFKKYHFSILLVLFFASLMTFIAGSFLLIKNLRIEEPTIKEATLHSNLTDYNHHVYTGLPITESSAKDKLSLIFSYEL